MNVDDFLTGAARFAPDEIGFTQNEREATYAALFTKVNRMAGGLQQAGIAPGDRVALSAPNVIEFVESYFAIVRAGAVVVPFNVLLKRDEIGHILADSGAKAVICHEGSDAVPTAQEVLAAANDLDELRHVWTIGGLSDGATLYEDLTTSTGVHVERPPTQPGDVAAILYTSGTTGRPKGACLTHANLVTSGMINAEAMDFRTDDRLLLPLPLFHVFGQVVFMLAGMFARARIDLVPRFEPEAVLEAMHERRSTIFGGVPTMYSALIRAADIADDGRMNAIGEQLRHCISGASALSIDLLHTFEKRFGTIILEGYGLTEASPTVAFARRDLPRRAGSVGYPMWGVDVRIADASGEPVAQGERGELLCRGPGVFVGYHGDDEATAAALRNGWLHTGDVAVHDPDDGMISIVDRVKDIVIRGGYNVYPREVEEVLVAHPSVALAAVIGVPDEHYGEEIHAFVTRSGASTPDERELIEHCKERLAAYKYPRRIIVRDELPLGGTGKVLKQELRNVHVS